MKFSIITPSYNQGKYIKSTLDSVLSWQQNCDIEHIVIDGGSQDDTLEILKEYADIYPNLAWYSAPDRGQSDAINKGLKLAQGEIIAYINSDDYYLKDAFIRVLEIFRTYPEVDFVYGDMFIVDELGEKVRRIKSRRASLWHHFYSFFFPQQSCFWRRRVLELVPEFNIDNKTCMDAEYFAHVLSQKVKFCRTSEALACFRIYDNSFTGSKKYSKKLQELYKADKDSLELQFMNKSIFPKWMLFNLGRIIKYIRGLNRPDLEIFQP